MHSTAFELFRKFGKRFPAFVVLSHGKNSNFEEN